MTTPPDPRFEIENPEMVAILRRIGGEIHRILPQGWGFGLFLFEYNGPAFFWISSGDRQDIIKALKEFIQREQAQ